MTDQSKNDNQKPARAGTADAPNESCCKELLQYLKDSGWPSRPGGDECESVREKCESHVALTLGSHLKILKDRVEVVKKNRGKWREGEPKAAKSPEQRAADIEEILREVSGLTHVDVVNLGRPREGQEQHKVQAQKTQSESPRSVLEAILGEAVTNLTSSGSAAGTEKISPYEGLKAALIESEKKFYQAVTDDPDPACIPVFGKELSSLREWAEACLEAAYKARRRDDPATYERWGIAFLSLDVIERAFGMLPVVERARPGRWGRPK